MRDRIGAIGYARQSKPLTRQRANASEAVGILGEGTTQLTSCPRTVSASHQQTRAPRRLRMSSSLGVGGADVSAFPLIGCDTVNVDGRGTGLHSGAPSPDSSPRRTRFLGCAV